MARDLVGWLSSEGEHHPCDWAKHDEYAHEQLQVTVEHLEKTGWARLTFNHGSLEPRMSCGQTLTEAQAKWLLEHDV